MPLWGLHDGCATLFRKVAEFDTESVETIIAITATDPEAAKAFPDAQCGRPLCESCHLAQGPLVALCLSLTPEDHSTA